MIPNPTQQRQTELDIDALVLAVSARLQGLLTAPIEAETGQLAEQSRCPEVAKPLEAAVQGQLLQNAGVERLVLNLSSGVHHLTDNLDDAAHPGRSRCGWRYQSALHALLPEATPLPLAWWQLCSRCTPLAHASAKAAA